MTFRLKAWCWGWFAVLAVFVCAAWLKTEAIEKRLLQETYANLERAGEGWAEISVKGRDLLVLGSAPIDERRVKALSIVEHSKGVRLASNDIGLIPVQKPYLWSIEKQKRRLIVNGYAPSPETREALMFKARDSFQDYDVIDSMSLASGTVSDARFVNAGYYTLALAKLISVGVLNLSDEKLSIEGNAQDTNSASKLEAMLQALPEGLTLDRNKLRPPAISPYEFRIAVSESDVALSGYISQGSQRDDLLTKIKTFFPAQTIKDDLALGDGAPPHFEAYANAAVSHAAYLGTGSVSLSDHKISVSGVSKTSEDFGRLAQSLQSLPDDLKLSKNSVKPPAVETYTWSASLQDSVVTLAGYVPSLDARRGFVESAKQQNPDSKLIDALRYADGEKPNYKIVTAFALSCIGKLQNGKATLTDSVLVIEGTPKNIDAYNALLAQLKQVPAQVVVKADDIQLPNAQTYSWGVEITPRYITLSGYVPDHETQDFILQRVRQNYPRSLRIQNKMQFAGGAAPEAIRQIADASLDRLRRTLTGSAKLTGLELLIEGQARDLAAYDVLIDQAPALPEGYSYKRGDISAPIIRPYTWSASHDAGKLSLAGLVMSNDARRAVLTRAQTLFPQHAVTDTMSLAGGAPQGADWISAAEFALLQLSKMKSGRVTISDNNFSAQGEAPDLKVQEELDKALRELPMGLKAQALAITPPSVSAYTWRAERTDHAVKLTGYVPDAQTRRTMVAVTRQLFSAEQLIDNLVPAGGAPADFARVWRGGLEQLARLAHGSVSINGKNIKIAGEAFNSKAVDLIDKALKMMPQAYILSSSITVKTLSELEKLGPGECQILLDDVLKRSRILFEKDVKIRAESAPVIDALAYTLQKCPNTWIEAGAYTDSDGDDQINIDISAKRARAVIEELAKLGIAPERLSAKGYGEANPIASNATEEGRALNRRIELTVK